MPRTFLAAAFLLGLCFSRLAIADEAASTPPATPQQVQQTVDRAIGYMQTESANWLSTRKCATCHHAAMPLWALGEADRQGYTTDKKFVNDAIESTLGSMEKMMASGLFPKPGDPPDPRPIGQGIKMGTVFMAFAARSFPSLEEGQKQSLKIITDEIIEKQREDGSWEFFLTRPPINESQFTDTVWTVIALQGEIGPDASESRRVALDKATAWLEGAKRTDDHQERVLRVLLAARAGKSRDAVQSTIDLLFARQRADGGWSQLPGTTSDAYATGQALYVLSLMGYTADQADIKRAIEFLVSTQKPDGSWPMVSRSSPDGRPGSSKLLTPINCAANAWAILGLARLVPMVK